MDTALPPDSPGAAWTVTASGIGPIHVGMSVAELRAAVGEAGQSPDSASACTYVRPSGAPPGVSVMLANGRVARIDADSAGVRTDAGAAVGDPESRIAELYAGRVTTTPHKYVAGGHYLTVKPVAGADSTNRVVFEAEGGRVTRFRVGRLPEVSWVERCG